MRIENKMVLEILYKISKTMNEEILSVVFSFAEYTDYRNFYQINIIWRHSNRKYINYIEFLTYHKNAMFIRGKESL
jgi:hypothetical protein